MTLWPPPPSVCCVCGQGHTHTCTHAHTHARKHTYIHSYTDIHTQNPSIAVLSLPPSTLKVLAHPLPLACMDTHTYTPSCKLSHPPMPFPASHCLPHTHLQKQPPPASASVCSSKHARTHTHTHTHTPLLGLPYILPATYAHKDIL